MADTLDVLAYLHKRVEHIVIWGSLSVSAKPIATYRCCVDYVYRVVHVEICMRVISWLSFGGLPCHGHLGGVIDVYDAVMVDVAFYVWLQKGIVVYRLPRKHSVTYPISVLVCAYVVAPVVAFPKTVIPSVARLGFDFCLLNVIC